MNGGFEYNPTAFAIADAAAGGATLVNHAIYNGKVVNDYRFDQRLIDTDGSGNGTHGNHVSGIVLSMAPGSKLWLGEFWDAEATYKNLIADIANENYYIASVNNSWSWNLIYNDQDDLVANFPITGDRDALQALLDTGVVVVAASGNGYLTDRMTFPGGWPGVVAAGNLQPDGLVRDSSNQYDKGNLFLMAPGTDVFSAYGWVYNDITDTLEYKEYFAITGTSMASPHVSGAVTLLQSGAREASGQEIIDSLYDSATPFAAVRANGEVLGEFRFLAVDRAYMDLTGKRMDMIGDAINPGLSDILYAYADELRADINQDTADIFQRIDAQDVRTQTAIARQMSPRFTNAVAESAHMGFVGLHRSMGRRAELNRLTKFTRTASCDPCAPVACDPCTPVGPCDDLCSPRRGGWVTNGWVEGFGTGFEKTGTLTNAAYDGHFAGTSFGIERKRGNRTLGLFGSWSDHRVNGDGLAKGDWGTFGAYGRVDRRDSFLEGSMSFGFGEYDMKRYIFIPGWTYGGVDGNIVLDPMFKTAEASTDTQSFATRLAAGRNLTVINGWTVGARGEFSLSYISFDRYQERGADSLNLSVDDFDTTYLEGGLGLFAGKHFRVGAERFTAMGKLMGMVGGVAGDDFSGSFVQYGSPYAVTACRMSTAWVVPEASLAWNVSKGLVFSGSYSGRFGEKYSENTGSVAMHLYW